MRIHAIAGAAIYLVSTIGCSGELAERPPANDPGSIAAAESPYRAPPSYQPDPLLSPVPPKNTEAPAPQHHEHGDGKPAATVYTCPMHPEVRQNAPGKCPKCGMTLVPAAPKGGGQ